MAAAGALALNLDAIAGDDTVNIAEKGRRFTISGDTGSEAGVSVSVTIGTESPLTATSDAGGAWSVAVPADAAYLTGTSVAVTVSASKTGYTPAERRDARPRGGPDGAFGELHGALVAAGGGGRQRHDAEHHGHGHRRIQRPRACRGGWASTPAPG